MNYIFASAVDHAKALAYLIWPRYPAIFFQTFTGPALLPEALRLERLALEILQTALGEGYTETLTAMSNLAETLRHQGDLPGARLLHEKALASRRANLA
jgi:hypothetical protein